MNIMGFSAYHHDSAAVNIHNNLIVGGSHEERFTRKKYDNSFPINTFRWLRNQKEQTDVVAFYEKRDFMDRQNIKRDIKKALPGKFDIEFFEHHDCHAMSSICTTDWDRCAVMVVDSMGGRYATSLGIFEDDKITWLKRFEYPNSLGLFYSTVTRFLGFNPLSDEEKVMSAAAYGEPKWAKYAKEKIINTELGEYTLLQDLRRGIGKGTLDWDVARSAQDILQECLINLASWLHTETGSSKLAYAGGVALNCVANTELVRYTGFKEIAIQPAAGDAGCALGAAALVQRPLWEGPYIGYNDSLDQNPEEIAHRIMQGEVVPVLNGKAEFGPRALGNRSILCLPTELNISKLNNIKKRINDTWRPYAPICLDSVAEDYFDIYIPSYDMLFVAFSETDLFRTHDDTARLQLVNSSKNGFLGKILEITTAHNHPILINTSLNVKGKPIVNSVDDFKNEMKVF